MEFLNYMLDKMGTIKNAVELLILILMGFCYILYSVRKHSARKNFVHQRADSGQKEKDDGEKAAKKIAAIVAVGLIGVFAANYIFNNAGGTEDVTASSNLTDDTVIVPNVVGMNAYEAEQVLTISGLYVIDKTGDENTFVSEQTLQPNTNVERGTEIKLVNTANEIETSQLTVEDYFHQMMNISENSMTIEKSGRFICWSNGMTDIEEIDLNKDRNPTRNVTHLPYMPSGMCFVQLKFDDMNVSDMQTIIYEYSAGNEENGFEFHAQDDSAMLVVPAGVYLIYAGSNGNSWRETISINASGTYDILLRQD